MGRLALRVVILGIVLAVGCFAPLTAANPGIPYCLGSVAPAPGVAPPQIQPALCESATGRVFPEAMARPEYAQAGNTGYATDFVAFPEFEAGLAYLESKYPDRIAVHKVAESYGLAKTPGGPRDRWPIYVVEVTNEKSPVPADDKLQLLFMLSIHGNEKGGREGGFRVLEDLAAGRGMANDIVQNGAGMPEPLAKPTGGEVRTYGDYLDLMRIVFLFPNVDGWMHDEAPYVSTAMCGTLYCRENGNGTDLNRQMPTIGWQMVDPEQGRLAVNEPEAIGYLPWLSQNHRWNYAIDIHGMRNHANFVAIMMPAGSLSPQEMQRSTRLAETLKDRLNKDPHFTAWTSLFGTAEDVGSVAVQGGQSPTTAVSSGEFSDWSTVWDAIGYTDSGFSGDFFAQSSGLNAPGYDIELAYNHLTFDSQYGVGALFNDYHITVVRSIFKSFMDAAGLDVRVSYETAGTKTLVIETQYVATNQDDTNPNPGGWADANPGDDLWQYTKDRPFKATPAKFWSDMGPFVTDGDKPGVLATLPLAKVTPDVLKEYTTLVIPGSAINQFVQGAAGSNAVADGAPDEARVKMVLDWVKAGGNLVLTDAGLKFFDLAGLTSGAVKVSLGYAGAINLDRAHELTKDVRGEARQTYEPVPLGFAVGFNAPIWGIDAVAFQAIKGDVAGTGYRGEDVSLGRVAVGSGKVQFIGALLPDPTEEFYHPYGLDDYATTYSGNQMLRNMLGWSEVFAAPPVIVTGDGKVQQSPNEPTTGLRPAEGVGNAAAIDGKGTPGPGVELVLLGLAIAFLARRRTKVP